MAFAECVEVSDFKFRQIKKFNITSDETRCPEKSVGILASSSRFGFIFAGHTNGFKVLQLKNILTINEADAGKDSQKAVDEFPHLQVTLPSDPYVLAISSDNLTLAVGIFKLQCPVVLLYDIRVFLTLDPAPSPFLEIRLSATPGVTVLDFFWNPSSGEMFAVCLSDGSVNVYEVSSPTSFKIIGSLAPINGCTSLSWSPKGKQLVVGTKSGRLSQFKPNLADCVKTVEQPSTFQNPVSVSSVLWLETHLFAAVYQIAQSDAQPSLVVVSVPKGGNPSYLNFNDVCYGNGDGIAKYWMHQLPTWKAMVCCSSTALETAIVATMEEKGPWVQWILEDSARAELPMVKSKETYPLGMSVITCAQNKIILSDTESYPAMPILLLLSTSGQLCPFHMIHMSCTTSMVTPPETLTPDGVRRSFSLSQPVSPVQSVPVSMQTVQTPILPAQGSIFGQPKHMSTPLDSISKVEPSVPVPKTNLLQKFTEESPKPTSLFAPLSKPEAQRQDPKPVASPGALTAQPGTFMFSGLGQSVPTVGSPPRGSVEPSFPLSSGSLFRPTNVTSGSGIAPLPVTTAAVVSSPAPVNTVSTKGTRPTLTAVAPSKSVLKTSSQDSLKSSADNTYVQALVDEIQDFQREIDELGSTLRMKVDLGTQEEMGLIRKNTHDADNFSTEIKKTVQSIQSDVNQLKCALVETFALLEEARSRDLRDRDPVYINLLRGRALDPCSQRQLKEIRRLAQYISGQLQEVHLKLDMDWQEQIQKTQSQQFSRMPVNHQGLSTLYQAIANNLAIIECLETSVSSISQQFKNLKSNKNSSLSFYTNSSDVNNLSTSLEGVSLSMNQKHRNSILQNSKLVSEAPVLPTRRSNRVVSKQQANALKEILTQRPIRVVKAKPLADLSQSRLVSALHTFQLNSSSTAKKVEAPPAAVPAQLVQVNDVSTVQQPPAVTTTAVVSPPVPVSAGISLVRAPPNVSVAPPTSNIFLGGITKGQPFKPLSEENKVSSATTANKVTGVAPAAFFTKTQMSTGTVITPPQTVVSATPTQPQVTPIPMFSAFQNKAAFPAAATTASSLPGKPSATTASRPLFFAPAVSVSPVVAVTTKAPDFKFSLPTSVLPVATSPSSLRDASPKFENITPPESPHPAAEIPEGKEKSVSPTEESKVIQISMNNKQADGTPVVKVSSLPAMVPNQPSSPVSQTPLSPVVSAAAVAFSFKAAASSVTSAPTSMIFSLSHLKTSDGSSATAISGSPATSTTASNFQLSTPSWGLGTGSAFSQPKFSFSSAAEKANVSTIATPTVTTVSSAVTSSAMTVTSVTNKPSVATFSTTTKNITGFQPVTTVLAASATTAVTTTQATFTLSHPVTSSINTQTPSEANPTPPITELSSAILLPDSSSIPANKNVIAAVETPPKSSAPAQPATTAQSTIQAPKVVPLFGQTTFGDSGSGTATPNMFGFKAPAVTSASVTATNVVTAVSTAVTASSPNSAVLTFSTNVLTPTTNGVSVSTVSPTISTTFSPNTTSTTTAPAAVPPTPPAVSPGFDQTAVTTASAFGHLPSVTTTASIFGQTTTPLMTAPLFGQVAVTAVPAFSQSGAPLFAPASTTPTTTTGSIFGSTNTPDVTPTSSATSVFGQAGTTTTPTLFGQPVSTAPSGPSIFSQTTAAQANPPSGLFSGGGNLTFGQPATTPAFGQQSQGVFGKGFGTSTFGQPQSTAAPAGPFGSMSATFGQTAASAQPAPAFGQTPTFGQAPAFGQQSTFGQKPTFGQSGSSVFGPTLNSGGSLFGQQQQQTATSTASSTPFAGNFFMGLGGKPSTENAGKNVFGGNFGNAAGAPSNLFGSQGASTFGSPSGGGFSGSFSGGGSVAQSGFAAFQQTPPRQNANFGSPPAFGSSPVFSGSPVFGTTPGFGTNTFGLASPSTTAPTFGTFGSTAGPSFDTLAAQSPTFSNLAQQPATGQPAAAPAFGSPPAFGSQFASQSSAFSQWRQ